MKVTYSETIMDKYTLFRVEGKIPKNSFSVVIDGKKHDLLQAYGYSPQMLSINGAFDLEGKEVEFTGRRT